MWKKTLTRNAPLFAAGLVLCLFGAGCEIPPPEVTVPGVTGMEQAEAEETLEDAGFTLGDVSEEYDDEVAEGMIISQDPEADELLEEGAGVDLVVSLGPEVEEVTVPDVTGMEQAEAEEALDEAGLTVGAVDEEHSDEVDEGIVISQAPEAGETVEEGASVDLVGSLGPEAEEVTVPDVTGMEQAEAEEALDEAGLTVDAVDEEHSDEVDEGIVISQAPEAGETVEEGASVDLVISADPEEDNTEDEDDQEEEG